MKPIPFEGNEQDCSFTYYRSYSGNYFVSFYDGCARGHTEPLECWRVLGLARYSATGKKLKEWCLEMVNGPPVED